MNYTDEQFTAAIRKAVEIRGADYVYPTLSQCKESPGLKEWRAPSGSCKYQVAGEPACLIGLALHLIDPKLVPDENYKEGAARVLYARGFSARAGRSAWVAQESQDAGYSWGTALAEYEREMGES